MFYNKNIFQYLIFIILALGVTSCQRGNPTQGAADFDELCHIYKGIVNQHISNEQKNIQITDQVYKAFPEFFNKDFINVLQSDPDQRYILLKKLAKNKGQSSWECLTIQSYYKG